MRDLFGGEEAFRHEIYQSLQSIRETFHREGKIGDSNAKLDETIKLLAIHFAHSKNLVSPDYYKALCSRSTFSVQLLNRMFSDVSSNSVFHRTGIGPIFGDAPTTAFRTGDEDIAFSLFTTAGRALSVQTSGERDLDILNEAFGHHVRDNFRNHIEDAQYMTPLEVVDFMINMALHLIRDKTLDPSKPFIVADPSCGVGSFLTRWRTVGRKAFDTQHAYPVKCIGQDKVERMVRLTAMNFLLSDSDHDDVFLGNSIEDDSPISQYDGKVDLILTNPPFGARFSIEALRNTSCRSTPFFSSSSLTPKVVDSEILFLDRYLTLLRPDGICLVIVPDGVISAKGISAMIRQHLARNAEILGIVELPPVTFAQAGTRTKTAVLGFRKDSRPRRAYSAFFAEATDLGFQVSKRKGATIRKDRGFNQLPCVLQDFQASDRRSGAANETGARAAWKSVTPGSLPAWTPKSLLFDRDTLQGRTNCELVPLKEFVKPSIRRGAQAYTRDTYFISVLHIVGEGVLDISGIKNYSPITPGLPIEPGEVLVSRINPRIPRVAVVPDLGKRTLCSAEYEILTPNPDVSPYTLAFLLLCPIVQEQLQSMTAGTSASHNRIKPGKMYDVLVPNLGGSHEKYTARDIVAYERACMNIVESLIELERVRNAIKI